MNTSATSLQNRRARFLYLGLLTLVLIIAGVGARCAGYAFSQYTKILGTITMKAFVFLFLFVVCHLILEFLAKGTPQMARLWPFKLVKSLRKTLWSGVILAFAVGVAGNLYSNHVQKNLDGGDRSIRIMTNVVYSIDVMLPSTYNDAQILVDGVSARVTHRTPSFATFLVGKLDGPHKLQIVKNSTVIREESFYATTNHVVLKPFQY